MPRKRIWLYAAVLFALIATILVAQVSWIVQSARIEQGFLDQRINMALCSAMDVLSKDKGMCSTLESCVARASGSFELTLSSQEKQKIDSVIAHHLVYYNIDVPFQTSFSQYPSGQLKKPLEAGQALLYPGTSNGMQNVLVELGIPSRNQMLLAQMNGTFLLSLAMLALLTLVFVSALRALSRERRIRRETVDLVNTMAHDLKTPISNISFAVSMFSRGSAGQGNPESRYLSILQTETDRLKQRARQILGIASVDAVLEKESTKASIDVHALIEASLESFALKVDELGGVINTALHARRPHVFANEVQLTSALNNVIDNALVYAQPRPKVEIDTRDDGDSVKITISDNGPGIPEAELELIFQKGYRMPGAISRTDGFGMGLYLSKILIEKQGGRISVDSDGRSGASFVIVLPLRSQSCQ